MNLKSTAVRNLERMGVAMTSTKHLNRMTEGRRASQILADRYLAYLEFIAAAPEGAAQELASVARAPQTQSQLGQDLFVLLETTFKRNGYFVEFGAADGVFLSNTYLLEMGYGWHGILAEPAKSWHGLLRQARTAKIDDRCVWPTSGENLEFNETIDAEYSTISSLNDHDQHSEQRKNGTTYSVPTISLNDLLLHHNAPQSIDYLSIDTEGSELGILSSLDFERYRFKIITCEHNFTPQREKIHDLLTSKGYVRKCEALSKWDDWYVLPTI